MPIGTPPHTEDHREDDQRQAFRGLFPVSLVKHVKKADHHNGHPAFAALQIPGQPGKQGDDDQRRWRLQQPKEPVNAIAQHIINSVKKRAESIG